jgi:hypothetical protein
LTHEIGQRLGAAVSFLRAVSGTLVVLVPSGNGLIVAADSRTTIGGKVYCDNRFKILIPRSPPRTVATVTGTGTFVAGIENIPLEKVCEHIHEAPRLLDIGAIVIQHLEANNHVLEAPHTEKLLDACVEAVRAYGNSGQNRLGEFAGYAMFAVVIAAFDPSTPMTRIRRFVVNILSDGQPMGGLVIENDFPANARREILAFGETDYLNKNVYGGAGRQFLSEQTIRFISQHGPIKDVQRDEAERVAVEVVEAVSKTTTIVAAPTGIGGPVDVVLLGAKSSPEKVRWKKV